MDTIRGHFDIHKYSNPERWVHFNVKNYTILENRKQLYKIIIGLKCNSIIASIQLIKFQK